VAAGALVIAVSVTAAGAAWASGPAPPAPRAGSCERMMHEYPAMARAHEQMMSGTSGMGQMSQQMAGGLTSLMVGDCARRGQPATIPP